VVEDRVRQIVDHKIRKLIGDLAVRFKPARKSTDKRLLVYLQLGLRDRDGSANTVELFHEFLNSLLRRNGLNFARSRKRTGTAPGNKAAIGTIGISLVFAEIHEQPRRAAAAED